MTTPSYGRNGCSSHRLEGAANARRLGPPPAQNWHIADALRELVVIQRPFGKHDQNRWLDQFIPDTPFTLACALLFCGSISDSRPDHIPCASILDCHDQPVNRAFLAHPPRTSGIRYDSAPTCLVQRRLAFRGLLFLPFSKEVSIVDNCSRPWRGSLHVCLKNLLKEARPN